MVGQDNETDGSSRDLPTSDASSSDSSSGRGIFPKTRWSLVLQMQDPAASRIASDALDELCQIYWHPVFVYIRTWGKQPADAEDLTQGFFSMILKKGSLDAVAEDRGKLRTFLLVALKRFLANEHHRESALKRGGRQKPVSIDVEWAEGRAKIDPASHESPDVLFERQWAMTVLDRALAQLRETYAADGKQAVFDALKFSISPASAKRPLAEIATEIGISEGATKVASHRLRQRYRETLQAVIAETVDSEEAVQEEIRYLLSVFRD